jgi:hypothetical protein
MARFVLLVLQVWLAIAPGGTPAPAVPDRARPHVTVVGGTADAQGTVWAAIARFDEVGLDLPDLEVRIHRNTDGCDGRQGLFRAAGDGGVVDLCFDREFLALHELAHAWEHFALDDAARDEFVLTMGFESWRSRATPWSHRGIERAADAIAYGLLDVPLGEDDARVRVLAQFELLTGVRTPRLPTV